MSYLEKNLNELRKSDPGLALKIESVKETGQLKVESAKTGKPTLTFQGKYLHSKYDPVKEGEKWAESFNIEKGKPLCLLGFGLGYHVKSLLKQIESPVYLIEPSLDTLKCAFEQQDFSQIISKIHWIAGKDVSLIIREYSDMNFQFLPYNPSVNLSPDFYTALTARLAVCMILESIKLKILVVNPIYGGSLPTAKYIKSALVNLGHHVEVMESDNFQDSFLRIDDLTSDQVNRGKLITQFTDFLGEATVARAADFGPDLIVAVAQAPLGKGPLQELKKLDAPVAFWFVEDFRVLSYWEKVAEHYDYLFTLQEGDFFEKLKANGIKNYHYLPQACAPEKHRFLNMTYKEKKSFECDLSFMGAGYYNRKTFFEKLVDFDFKIWGSGWDLSSTLGRLVQEEGTRVDEEGCVKIFNAAKINLNLHSSSYHEGVNPVGDFVNPRTFEIAACGGFQLVDYRSGLPELFDIGKEIICYRNLDELRSLIDYYLKNPDKRKEIADRGQARVKKHHSFENRMREMLSIIFEDKLETLTGLGQKSKPVEQLIEEAGSETEVGKYLAKFKNRENFALKDIIEDIEKGEGSLSKVESLFLIINQFIKEKGESIRT